MYKHSIEYLSRRAYRFYRMWHASFGIKGYIDPNFHSDRSKQLARMFNKAHELYMKRKNEGLQ